WRSSPDRERPMVRLKRSTAGLNICAGLLWGSVTSPTTSPGVCSSPVASDRFYTLNYDEPFLSMTPDRPCDPQAEVGLRRPHWGLGDYIAPNADDADPSMIRISPGQHP